MVLSFTDTSSIDNFLFVLMACELILIAYLAEIFLLLVYRRTFSVSFDFFCFGVGKLAWADFLLASFVSLVCINKAPSDRAAFLHDWLISVSCCFNIRKASGSYIMYVNKFNRQAATVVLFGMYLFGT